MRNFEIGENEANQRLDKFLQKLIKGVPPSFIYKCIRKKRIKVNGKKADIEYKLQKGDVLSLYLGDEFFTGKVFTPSQGELDIFYEDENLLIVNKKAGVPCQPDIKHPSNTLVDRVKTYLYSKNEYDPSGVFSPALCNRIDTNTEGLVIAAKNAEALRIINEKIRLREIKKYYLCVVHGTPNPKCGEITSSLKKDEKSNKTAVSDSGVGARTIYRTLEVKNNLSLCEIELVTGRSHQIRAHMASIGCPLYGDKKYGGTGAKHQALCAYKIVFNFQTPAGVLEYLNNREFKLNSCESIRF